MGVYILGIWSQIILFHRFVSFDTDPSEKEVKISIDKAETINNTSDNGVSQIERNIFKTEQ